MIFVDSRDELEILFQHLSVTTKGMSLKESYKGLVEESLLIPELGLSWSADAFRKDPLNAAVILKNTFRSLLGERRRLCIKFQQRHQLTRDASRDGDECPICNEKFGEYRTVLPRCGHRLHLACYNQTRHYPSGAVCSLCRASFGFGPWKENASSTAAIVIPPCPSRVPASDRVGYAKADFDGGEYGKDYLSFVKNMELHISTPRVVEEGWLHGRCGDNVGWFPPSYFGEA